MSNAGEGAVKILSDMGHGEMIVINKIREMLPEKRFYVNPILKECSDDPRKMFERCCKKTRYEEGNEKLREINSATRPVGTLAYYFAKIRGYQTI